MLYAIEEYNATSIKRIDPDKRVGDESHFQPLGSRAFILFKKLTFEKRPLIFEVIIDGKINLAIGL